MWRLLAIGVAIALLGGGCRRGKPMAGTCQSYLDCEPGFRCVDARCAPREKVPGEPAGPSAPGAVDDDVPPGETPPAATRVLPASAPMLPPPLRERGVPVRRAAPPASTPGPLRRPPGLGKPFPRDS